MKKSILIGSLILVTLAGPLLANKNLVQRRVKRLQFAVTQWQSTERVMINVHYRVPVYETLGYLAANIDDDKKLVAIAQRLRPIAKRVNELSDDHFEGRSFPKNVEAETQDLAKKMFSDVQDVYGQQVEGQLKAYLTNWQKAFSGDGFFGMFGNSVDA